jgi:predicted patatin/cPLA2 family phospholipase
MSYQSNIGDIAGGPHKEGYWSIAVDGKRYLRHRLAWLYMTGSFPTVLIDHDDKNRSNDKWSNLREADKSQSAANSSAHKDSSSGLKGVYWSSQKSKWIARVSLKGKHYHLGCFSDPIVAKQAYDVAAQKLFGAYARST